MQIREPRVRVSRWLVVGPFGQRGERGLRPPLRPRGRADGADRSRLTRSYDGKERPVRWRVAPGVSPFGWLDIGGLPPPRREGLRLRSDVRARRARSQKQKVPAVNGARSPSGPGAPARCAFVVEIGSEVLKDDKYRMLDSDRFAAARVTSCEAGLEPPPGEGRAATTTGQVLSLRLGGADGAPDANLRDGRRTPPTAPRGSTRDRRSRGRPRASSRWPREASTARRIASKARSKRSTASRRER